MLFISVGQAVISLILLVSLLLDRHTLQQQSHKESFLLLKDSQNDRESTKVIRSTFSRLQMKQNKVCQRQVMNCGSSLFSFAEFYTGRFLKITVLKQQPGAGVAKTLSFKSPLDYVFYLSCVNNVAAIFGFAGVLTAQRELVQAFFAWNAVQMVSLPSVVPRFTRLLM